MKKILFIMVALTTAALLQCSALEGDYTLTLNLTRQGIDDNTKVYAKLVDQNSTPEAVSLYAGSATFSNNTATIKIDKIKDGTYSGFIFIDESNDAEVALPMPDCDEYVAGNEEIKIEDDVTINVLDNEWVLFSTICTENEWDYCTAPAE